MADWMFQLLRVVDSHMILHFWNIASLSLKALLVTTVLRMDYVGV
jgi:hypothetical protein